jgi:hypothetical protein
MWKSESNQWTYSLLGLLSTWKILSTVFAGMINADHDEMTKGKDVGGYHIHTGKQPLTIITRSRNGHASTDPIWLGSLVNSCFKHVFHQRFN